MSTIRSSRGNVPSAFRAATGLVLSLAIAASTSAAERFMTLADFGTEASPRPDGFADRLLWDDLRRSLTIHYVGPDGLDGVDRSDQVVEVDIVSAGRGYGRGPAGREGLRNRRIERPMLPESVWTELARITSIDPEATAVDLWTIDLVVDHEGTEGTDAAGFAVLDGRAGGWSYYPVNLPWRRPDLDEVDLPLSPSDNDLRIVDGGSGYLLPPARVRADQSGLVIRIEGDDLGTLGFAGGGPGNRYLPGVDEDLHETHREFVVTGDILNPLAPRPGNWRNLLAHTPVSADARRGWRLPWAASRPGQIANLLILADGTDRASGVESILHDDSAAARSDRVSPPDESAPFRGSPTEDSSSPPAEVESTVAEPTSGIGYTPGYFQIRDADGHLVTGWRIRYETDAQGRVYANAKGSVKPGPGQLTEDRVGAVGAEVFAHGWTIERNPAAVRDCRGWTVTPEGDGTGFRCEGLQLFGELVALPPLSNQNMDREDADVRSAPTIRIEPAGTGIVPEGGLRPPQLDLRTPATGQVLAVITESAGSGYYRTPAVQLATVDCDEPATLAARLGTSGRSVITRDGVPAEIDLEGWRIHANGDFNGDQTVDLFLHHPATGASAIWNLGDRGEIEMREGRIMAHALPVLTPDWQVGGIGRFGHEGPGCGVLWRHTLTGQNVIWIIDSSRANPDSWIRPHSDFLPTVMDQGWGVACSNNAVQNIGDRLYWTDPRTGSLAQWRIAIDPARPGSEWVDEPDYLRNPDGDRIMGMRSSWRLIGAASLGGQPRSDGRQAFRDLLFFDEVSGRVAIWLLDGSGTRIDGRRPGGGAGFLTRSGSVIAGTIKHCRPVGIGQYALPDIEWTRGLAEHDRRTQWFPTIGWEHPDAGWFTWRLDRQIDPVRSVGGLLKGSGQSARPFRVEALR